jgi:hypothetical protein
LVLGSWVLSLASRALLQLASSATGKWGNSSGTGWVTAKTWCFGTSTPENVDNKDLIVGGTVGASSAAENLA